MDKRYRVYPLVGDECVAPIARVIDATRTLTPTPHPR